LFHVFLTLTLDLGDWSASRLGLIYFRGRCPGTQPGKESRSSNPWQSLYRLSYPGVLIVTYVAENSLPFVEPEVNYCVHKSLSLDHILNQLSADHTPEPYF